MTVSVYITSYNHRDFLVEALESVLNQTSLPDEILIIDDASTDGSQELIQEYSKRYSGLITYQFNNINKGITRCRNQALRSVNGEYVTALDGDDAFLPKKLEVQKQLLHETNADLVYSNFYFARNELTNIGSLWYNGNGPEPPEGNIGKEIFVRDFPNGTLFRNELVKTSLMREIGEYDESLSIYEDYDFRIRLGMKANARFCPEPLSIYRLHGSGLSRAAEIVHIDTLSRIFEKYNKALDNLWPDDIDEIHKKQRVILSSFSTKTQKKKSFLVTRLIKRINRILRF